MRTNEAGVNLIKFFEGIKDGDPSTPALDPYLCPTGYVTIGWGHVYLDEEGNMLRWGEGLEKAKALYKPINMNQAEDLLRKDLLKYEAAVRSQVYADVTENQFSAMVSLCFNIGIGNFAQSSVLRHHKAGQRTSDLSEEDVEYILENVGRKALDKVRTAPDAFLLWKMGGGVILPGLQKRRKAERELYLK